MIRFVDLLYGFVEVPSWLLPFIKLPEFIRLRGIRLSNVDSIYFKDFAGPTRWEHGISVASLAYRCATKRQLTERERVQLTLAGLLHDVGTPPFAHTPEAVLANFDHELEGQQLLSGRAGDGFAPDAPVFQSQLPQFRRACEHLSRDLHMRVDPDEVAKCISGDGDLGFLINGPIDLDNADNVTRSSFFVGLSVSGQIPIRVADWLALQPSVVTDLGDVEEEAVREWVSYRNRLYTAFFEADEGEIGRMAFLQHLMRRALDVGMERSQLIWSTDEGLMNLMAQLDDTAADDFRPPLSELVQRYRLLETPTCLARVDIEDSGTLRVLRHPDAVAWITKRLRSDGFEPMVLALSRRFSSGSRTTLLPEPVGTLYIFHLGAARKVRPFESRIRAEASQYTSHVRPTDSISVLLSNLIHTWCKERPWSVADESRKRNVTAALKSVGDWGFRLSRNDSFHAYPSTFVHAIPANLLVSLGVKEDLVFDPFGGTAQTASEAIKYGNSCVTADVNKIACLIAKARLSFLPLATRERIRALDDQILGRARSVGPRPDPLLDKWFNTRTLCELGHIRGFLEDIGDQVLQTFLEACLSAILPSCTARRGEQHGYFADNCPLPRGKEKPPYQPAIKFFLEKTRQAVCIAERLYGFIERQGRDPANELNRVTVRHVDIRTATLESYGLKEGEVGAIITSPPYLCMADYALGQRLSYDWLLANDLKTDFEREIGARRLRLGKASETVVEDYCNALGSFAKLAAKALRKGGFLGVVLGQPLAKQYRSSNLLARLDGTLRENGFDHLWHTERAIHWHRNHGYARLKRERISVHVRM